MPENIEHIITVVYEEYSNSIFRHCFLRVSERELAKDLMQETFMRVFSYLQKGNHIENMRAFLYKTANNLIIDHSRKPRVSSLDYLQEKGFSFRHHTKDDLEIRIDASDVIKKIGELDEKYRTVLLLRYVDDLSPKEIGAIVGETENTVSVRIHRGLEKLRTLIHP